MSRRGNAEGSIYKRKDGRWAAAISVGGPRRKAFYGKTRRDVQLKLIAALRDKHLGLPIAPERQMIGHFLDAWLQQNVKPTVRPRTFIRYGELVRLHLRPKLGNVRLARLTPQQVQAAMNEWLKEGLSPRTVEHIRAVLRRALNQAVRWNLVSRNAAALTDAPKYERSKIRVLTPEEVKAFVLAVKGNELEAVYLTALMLGLREGEVLGLRWEDINLDARTLRVSSSLQRIGGKLTLVPPKTDRSRRTLILPLLLASSLRGHRVRQMEQRLAAGAKWEENGFVFPARFGTGMDARNLLRRYYAVLKSAGLPHMRFHDLRHSCATLLLAQGVAPRVIMEVLGHSQIAVTMNTYSHVMPSLLSDAASAMDTALLT